MTLQVKDANQTTQTLATLPDASSNLVPEHAVASSVAGVATPVSTTAPLPVINTAGAVATGGNTTITLGGTAQSLFSGATPTNGFSVQNLDDADDLWVNDLGVAGIDAGFKVLAGQTYTTPSGYKPAGAVSVWGVTTGNKLCARRW